MRVLLGMLLVSLACSCTQEGGGASAEGNKHQSVVVIDKTSRPGRLFAYLGEGGQVVKVARYTDIPENARDAVIVIENGVRKPLTQPKKKAAASRDGGPAVGPGSDGHGVVSRVDAEAAQAAQALLQKYPPQKEPVSASSSPERWDAELKNELNELKGEEEKAP